MKYKIVIFDLDGVLVDSTDHVVQFFVNWFPGLTKAKVHEMWTRNFDEAMAEFRLENKPIEETEEERSERNRVYSEKKMTLPVHDGIREFLDELHQNKHILVVNTAALEKNCVPLLERAGILDKFDFVATKKLSPSKTEKFKIISEKYQVDPKEMVFITDTVGDIKDAERADVPTIAVTWGAHNESFFKREPYKNLIAIVNTVDELKSVVM